ncbi:MAG: hypothetical protein R3336_00630, partial [Phycisphaeraceae bacterium]|nr:hypothetical protein [Phycisphaeraceae bacterium]
AQEEVQAGNFRSTTVDSFEHGHENFLHRAVTYTYLYGDKESAAETYDRLRELYGDKPHNIRKGRYKKPLDDFVMDLLENDLHMLQQRSQFIDAMIHQALTRGLANGRRDVYDRFLTIARAMHKAANDTRQTLDPNMPRGRLQLAPFPELLRQRYIGFMRAGSLPLLQKSRVWRYTPEDLKRQTFDELWPDMQQAYANIGLNPKLAMPEPEGMDKWREQRGDQVPGDEDSDDPAQLRRQ